MSQPLAQGGPVITGPSSVTLSSGTYVHTTNTISNMGKQIGITVEKMKNFDHAVNYCHNRKGGPRSKIFCEVPKGVPHDVHAGRSKGRWYYWEK